MQFEIQIPNHSNAKMSKKAILNTEQSAEYPFKTKYTTLGECDTCHNFVCTFFNVNIRI